MGTGREKGEGRRGGMVSAKKHVVGASPKNSSFARRGAHFHLCS